MAQRDTAGQGETRDGFRFRGGHPALDLAATLAARLKPAPRELLNTPADLGRWLAAAGLAPGPRPATSGDLAKATELREAIYRLAVDAEDDPDARAALNRIAAGQPATPELGPDRRLRLVGSAAAVLATLARDAIQLFGGDQADRVRQCQADGCAILFLDTSRAGDRRWCSMAGCGNKMKVADFRRRRRQAADSPP